MTESTSNSDLKYTLAINDFQRDLFVRALTSLMEHATAVFPSPLTSEQRAEILLMQDMLENLAEMEKENPGVVHGFCY